jgi:Arc/MetJ-type ribon-helix-helix transcriptional regulator
MKTNTKSSITLPPEELRLVVSLQARLKAKSKVEVVRRGLRLLQETTDRERMREAYRRASLATRESLAGELKELELTPARARAWAQAARVERLAASARSETRGA